MTSLWQPEHEVHRAPRSADAARGAVRVAVGFGTSALLYLALANLWMSTCSGSTADGLACGAPSRSVLTAGAPLLLLAGAIVATRRGQRAHDEHTDGTPWMAAGLALAALTVLSAVLSWSLVGA